MDVVPKRHFLNHARISGRSGNFNYEIVFLETVHFHKLCVFGIKVVSKSNLVGGFNPSENISQIGNLPQIGMKIKNI